MAGGEQAATAAAAPQEVVQAGERRVARIESLRALAALAVAAGHAWGLSYDYDRSQALDSFLGKVIFGGGFGVYLFFALSGYLLFWPFARRGFGAGAAIDLKRYAINRFVRIMPLYWAAVIILLLLQEKGGSFEQWWRFLLLAENFSRETVGTVDGALWSLVVEVHFYVLLPFIAWGLERVARGRKLVAAAVLAGLGLASLALFWTQVRGQGAAAVVWRYNIPTTFFYFVPGMLLALWRLELEAHRPRWLDGPLGSSTVWLLASVAVWLYVFDRFDGPVSAVASFLAVGACALPLRTGALLRALDWRPLAAIGVVSYSLYVWHSRVMENLLTWDAFPEGRLGLFGLALPLSVGVAFLSYRVIEAPFLRLRRRWSTASAPMEPAAGSGKI